MLQCVFPTVAEAGLEPTSFSSGKTPVSGTGGAESGAVGAENAPIDPDLANIIDAWPTLPEGVKAGITAMVEGAAARPAP